ncbi:hypothetical protein Bca52824_016083 [Brassica carinata]|uniref:Uncharacterized protein n=1 Tax=Brassica carinata TaxID=52824 RepID=A0A8X8B525_BRACI|nr:hypothetical protein Bca52824_016083 [Brassica carinata]
MAEKGEHSTSEEDETLVENRESSELKITEEQAAKLCDRNFGVGTTMSGDDGLHFRQPWVIGVEEEVLRLRKEVDAMAAEIAALKLLIPRV